MVLVGSSEVSGSWKIIAISLPRTRRRSSCFRPTSSRPSSLIEPPTMDPPGGSKPMMDNPVMDLPQPDSPTTPRVSPASMCMSTLPTGCTTELVSLMCVDRSWISSTGAMWAATSRSRWLVRRGTTTRRMGRLTASQPDIQGIAECVADEVEGHHGEHDADADRVDQPPVAVLHVTDAVGDHVAPVQVGVLQPEAKEADVGDGQDGIGHLERHVDDDHAERIRQQVAADQPPVTGTCHPRGVDEVAFPDREHLAPDQPGRDGPGERADDQGQRQYRGAVPDRQDEHYEQERHGQEHVHHAHQRGVDEAAGEPRDRADQSAEGYRNEGGEEADLQCGLAALHELPENVEAVDIGAERVSGPRRVVGVDEVGLEDVPVVEQRS